MDISAAIASGRNRLGVEGAARDEVAAELLRAAGGDGASRTVGPEPVRLGGLRSIEKELINAAGKNVKIIQLYRGIMTHRRSHVAPGPSVVLTPGGLVWMKNAPSARPLSSPGFVIFSSSITNWSGSCLVYASTLCARQSGGECCKPTPRTFAPNNARIWSEITSTDSLRK